MKAERVATLKSLTDSVLSDSPPIAIDAAKVIAALVAVYERHVWDPDASNLGVIDGTLEEIAENLGDDFWRAYQAVCGPFFD